MIGKNSIRYERKVDDLYTYNILTGKKTNITSGLPIPYNDFEFFQNRSLYTRKLEVAGWLKNDKAVLVYDKYDIWQLDPDNKVPPKNLTNGLGRRNNIVFRLSSFNIDENGLLRSDKLLHLKAFDLQNKNSGYYSIQMGKNSDPILLSFGPYQYEEVVKSIHSEIYIVTRQSSTQSPKYFWTRNFKSYFPLSDVYPEKKYNWLSSELLHFETRNGRSSQGVLYKPENFNPKKKYPVIIHYYETMSDNLNGFIRPDPMSGPLNVSWFVSRGYIVFTPDIIYGMGEVGKNALDAIVGAADLLSKFSWIDEQKIAIQGHSFGGFETNYIVANSDLFAAAVSSSGFSDLVSGSGSIRYENGEPFWQEWTEVGQGRIGANLWERPDLYIRNSPVFAAGRVSTPLLMMNNKKDGIVNFSQGVELFTSLRRLGKRVWMLQYDDGVHIVYGKDAIDYTLRVTQFFDHYLKEMPSPKWMLEGIPAKNKGLDDGLKLEEKKNNIGKWLSPSEGGILTEEERKKSEALKHRKPIAVTIE